MTVRYAHLAPAQKLATVDRLAEYRREQEKEATNLTFAAASSLNTPRVPPYRTHHE